MPYQFIQFGAKFDPDAEDFVGVKTSKATRLITRMNLDPATTIIGYAERPDTEDESAFSTTCDLIICDGNMGYTRNKLSLVHFKVDRSATSEFPQRPELSEEIRVMTHERNCSEKSCVLVPIPLNPAVHTESRKNMILEWIKSNFDPSGNTNLSEPHGTFGWLVRRGTESSFKRSPKLVMTMLKKLTSEGSDDDP